MAISLHTSGDWQTAASGSVTPTLPTHSTGDMLLVRVAYKSSNIAACVASTATSGWALVSSQLTGTGNSGNGTGGVSIAVFWKEAASASETAPTIDFSQTVTQVIFVAMAYQKGGSESWETPVGDGGQDLTANTSHSATIASHVSTTAGDLVDFITGIRDDCTMTVPTFTQTGVTYGAVDRRPTAYVAETSGADMSADGGYRIASSGTSSAAAVVTGTTNTNETGSSYTTRLRVYMAGSFAVDAVIKANVTGTPFTADAVQLKNISVSVGGGENGGINAWIAVSTTTYTFTDKKADAVLLATIPGATTANAILKRFDQPGSFAANAVLLRLSQPGSTTLDAVLKKTQSFTTAKADAVLRREQTGSFAVNAIKLATIPHIGDLSLAAHGTPIDDDSVLSEYARGSTGDVGYAVYVLKDTFDIYGFGANHVVLDLQRVDTTLSLAYADLGLVTWLTEWQLRLDIWGDPTAVFVRGRAYHTGDTPPAWTTTTDDYALIPRSDDTFTQNVTLDSAGRAPYITLDAELVIGVTTVPGSFSLNAVILATITATGATVITQDSFTDADDTPIGDHAPDVGIGWTEATNGDIQGNKASFQTEYEVALLSTDGVNPDTFLDVDVWMEATPDLTTLMLVGRGDGTASVGKFYTARAYEGDLIISRWDLESETIIWTAGESTSNTGLHFQVRGSNPTTLRLRSWWPGNTTEGSTWEIDTTDNTAGYQQAGGVGLGNFAQTSAFPGPSDGLVDNFLATTPSAGPTLDAVISGGAVSGSFTTDAVLRKEQTGAATVDAVLRREQAGSLTADAILRQTRTGTFAANAIILSPMGAGGITTAPGLYTVESSTKTSGTTLSHTMIDDEVGDTLLVQIVVDGLGSSGSAIAANEAGWVRHVYTQTDNWNILTATYTRVVTQAGLTYSWTVPDSEATVMVAIIRGSVFGPWFRFKNSSNVSTTSHGVSAITAAGPYPAGLVIATFLKADGTTSLTWRTTQPTYLPWTSTVWQAQTTLSGAELKSLPDDYPGTPFPTRASMAAWADSPGAATTAVRIYALFPDGAWFTADALIEPIHAYGSFSLDAIIRKTQAIHTQAAGWYPDPGFSIGKLVSQLALAEGVALPIGLLMSVEYQLNKVGSPTDNVVVEFCADDGNGKPGAVLATIATHAAASLPTWPTWVSPIHIDLEYPITVAATYYIVWRRDGSLDASNYFVIGGADEAGELHILNDGVWVEGLQDAGFRLDLLTSRFTLDAWVFSATTGSFTSDAVLLRTQAGTIAIDAIVRREQTGAITADAIILRTQPGSTSADAVIIRSQLGGFTVAAVIKATIAGSTTVNAAIGKTTTGSLTADAVLYRVQTGSFAADAWLQKTVTSSFATDATLLATLTGSFTAAASIYGATTFMVGVDAVIRREMAGSYAVDAVQSKTFPWTFTAEAWKVINVTGSTTADAVLRVTGLGSTTVNAAILRTFAQTTTLDAVLLRTQVGSLAVDAILLRTQTGSLTADAWLQKTVATSLALDAVIGLSATGSFAADATILRTATAALTTDAVVTATITGSFAAAAVVTRTVTGTFLSDAVLTQAQAGSLTADAVLYKTQPSSFTADAIVRAPSSEAMSADAVVLATRAASLALDAVIGLSSSGAFSVDAVRGESFTVATTADAVVLRTQTGTIDVAAWLSATFPVSAWLAGAIRVDAFIQSGTSGATILYATIKATVAGSFVTDAIVLASAASSSTIDAWLQRTNVSSATLDAVRLETRTGSLTVQAVIGQTANGTLTLDAVVLATRSASTSVDAIILTTGVGATTVDAWVISPTAGSGSFTAAAVVLAQVSASTTADAVIAWAQTGSFTAGAWVAGTGVGAFVADAIVSGPASATIDVDAVVLRVLAGTLALDSVKQKTVTLAALTDAVIRATRMVGAATDAVLLSPRTSTLTLDAEVSLALVGGSTTLDATFIATRAQTADLDAVVAATAASTFTVGAWLTSTPTSSFILEAQIAAVSTTFFTLDAALAAVGQDAFSLDASISRRIVQEIEATFSALTSAATLSAQTIEGTFAARTIAASFSTVWVDHASEGTLTLDAVIGV